MKVVTNHLPPNLEDNRDVAIDTEWFGLDENRLHRPGQGKFGCMTVCYDPDLVFVYTDPSLIGDVLERVDNTVWTMHNAKFDITHLRDYTGIPPRTRLADTYMLERILWNGYYDRFALDDLARRYLGIHLDKSLQKKWGTMTEMTPEMLEYAVNDASVQLRVWQEQKKHITKSDWNVYKTIDLPAMWAVMDFRGFRLDVEGWRSLAENNRAEAKKYEDMLDFNPRSPQQVVKALSSRGFEGIKSSGAEVLEEFILKHPDTQAAKEAEVILSCREYSTFASRYGKKWLDVYLETFPDGTQGFVPNFNLIGAETGRMSASDPAMHQIPARSTKVFREKFIASPGHKLVMADYSQQEVVILAYVAEDQVMMELCNSGEDAYILVAKEMFGLDITKKDPLRKRMKSVVLGTDYGMSEFGLAKREGISVKEAATIISLFRKKFKGVDSYMNRMEKQKGYVQTVAGRKFYLNHYSSQSYRNALNAPIQGTAADIIKKAVAEMRKGWEIPCSFGIVNVIHDEIVLDVPEGWARATAEFTQETMVRVANEMCPGMRFRADAVIGDNWSQKE